MLLLYAEKDMLSLDLMSLQFRDALKKKKVDVDCVVMKDRNHIDSILKIAANEAEPGTQEMLQFIAKHSDLKLKPREEKKEK
jgi:hypothetical protein